MMRKNRNTRGKFGPKAAWALAVLGALCILFRALSGKADGVGEYLKNNISQTETVRNIISLEMGPPIMWTSFFELFTQNSQDDGASDEDDNAQTNLPQEEVQENQQENQTEVETQQPQTPESISNGVLDGSGITLKNSTDYDIDIDGLLNEPLKLDISESEPSVLIIHTHGSESYMPDDSYEESDSYRTEDSEYNVVKVGSVLEQALESYGINVVHDTYLYDYPEYTGAYSRALDAIEKWLVKYPSISTVIDLHRDAISDENGKQYKTVAQIGQQTCSQILLVVGTDYSGLEHPQWRENMKFALRLQ
jgi:stage II sporulation protein P